MKVKRIVRRPWGRKRNGGWVIQPDELLTALKDGEIAEIGKLHVGARQLSQLIKAMRFPDEELLVTSNGQLEMQNLKRVIVQRNGHRQTGFRKPKCAHMIRLERNAWVPKNATTTVVIKPRKF